LWAPVAIYMAGIFYVSSLHQPPLPSGVDDKFAHATAYMGLGFVIARALAGGLPPRLTWSLALIGFLIALIYGASDEFHQSFVAGRDSDILDLRADAIGAAIAMVVCRAWGIISPAHHER
jgi:VanZ family protein